jgi:hypothetical protein
MIVGTVLILIALILGFVFPGIGGAFLFGLLFTIGILLIRQGRGVEIKLKRLGFQLLLLSLLGFMLMDFLGGVLNARPEVKHKLDLIEVELKKENYNPMWIIISQKRNKFLNDLLPKSAKGTSYHLQGRAIDIYVFDIDGNGVFNKSDIKIIESAINKVEKDNPALVGALGDYYLPKNDFFTRHMIHIDTRGGKARYSK